jgi:hypothetical protein
MFGPMSGGRRVQRGERASSFLLPRKVLDKVPSFRGDPHGRTRLRLQDRKRERRRRRAARAPRMARVNRFRAIGFGYLQPIPGSDA